MVVEVMMKILDGEKRLYIEAKVNEDVLAAIGREKCTCYEQLHMVPFIHLYRIDDNAGEFFSWRRL
jgi:hypothetical protein